MKIGTLHRSATFDRAAINEESRSVALAFSSEAPVERWFGDEILDHTAAACNLDRLRDGGPLLLDHEACDVIGVVEQAQIDADRVGRAVVRFSKSALGEEVFRDVLDGIRTKISVGYRAIKMRLESENKDTGKCSYRVTEWEPLEISVVSIPADNSVGIGRADDSTDFETVVEGQPQAAAEIVEPLEKRTMTDITVIENAARDAERTRVREITAIGDLQAKHGGVELARQYIGEGKSVDAFRAALLDKLATAATESVTVTTSAAETREYSYTKAIAAALARAEGQNVSGLEVEISQDIERNMPASYKRNGGIFVPLNLQRTAISTALYNTSGKGASTVFTQPGDFIELLRNASVAVRLGARVLSGLTGPVSFPSQTAGASVSWVAENSGTDVTASNATLSSVSLSPKTLQGTTAFSRQLMAQSSLDVEAFIRGDLAAAHGLAWDLAVMHGTGSNNQPTGIYAASGVNSVAFGGVPSYGKIIDMVTEVLTDNALAGSLAFATTPGLAGKMAQTVIAASTDTRMIWDGALDNGRLAGYQAVASNQVSAALGVGTDEHGIVFGNWSDVLIGNWGALEVVVDPYSLKKQGMIEVTTFQLVDIALRHASSFCKGTGAKLA